jgi:alpha-tubulin suppressor-like RCC1 family protein
MQSSRVFKVFKWAPGLLAAGLCLGASPARASEGGRDYVPFFSAGATHVAFLQGDGNIVQWGTDAHGELGDNAVKSKSSVPVCAGGCNQNLSWTQVAAGTSFTLARRSDGTIWAWGSSDVNRNGAGDSLDLPAPSQTGEGGNYYTTVAAGATHGFTITAGGTLYGWGDNSQGELGQNTTDSPGYGPEQQTGSFNDKWIAVTPGTQFTIALKADGSAWGFGLNSKGQLGTGNTTRQLAPVLIPSTKPWTRISAGVAHAAGIKADGTLWLWGANDKGQLGNNTTSTGATATPVQLTSTSGPWIAVSAGGHFTMAVKADGTLWGWGDNGHGQLGIASTSANKTQAVQIGSLNTWQYVSAGLDFTVAVKADGSAYTFGHAGSGQLGNNTTTDINAPVAPVLAGSKPPLMVGGAMHGGAIRASGVLETNGYDGDGQLGIGVVDATAFAYPEPNTVASTLPWRHMAMGATQTLGVKSDGSLWGWGGNYKGEVGTNNTTLHSSPVQVGTSKKWVKVFANYSSSFGIQADGTLWAWGDNTAGHLGDNSTTNRKAPVPVGASLNEYWVMVSPGYNHTLGVTADGKLWAWGSNGYGQLGDNSHVSQSNVPEPIGTLTNWTAVASGDGSSAALQADSTLTGWGYNANYEVGDGTNTIRVVPTAIGSNVIRLCHADLSAIALTNDGYILGWGENGSGELGNSTYGEVTTPTVNQNTTSFNGTVGVACGTTATYLWATSGPEYGEGDNRQGALGIQANGPDFRNIPEELDRFIRPEAVEPLQELLTASVTQSGHSTDFAFSTSDSGQYWSTGVAQASGQWFKAAFDAPTEFSQIILRAGTSTTYPRAYQVFVSNDNTNWGTAIATGVGTEQTLPISFAQQNARYIKITLTGSSTSSWTIDSFEAQY